MKKDPEIVTVICNECQEFFDAYEKGGKPKTCPGCIETRKYRAPFRSRWAQRGNKSREGGS